MTTRLSAQDERRLFNQIWNGARKYKFEPDFIAKDLYGNPDFYMNLVIGLSFKYFGQENISRLFLKWSNNFKATTLDLITWITLENLVYRMELAKRPVLYDLRKAYAYNFQNANELKKKIMAYQMNLAYSLYDYKTKEILGEKQRPLSKKNQVLYGQLMGLEADNYEDLEKRLLEILTKRFTIHKPVQWKKGHGFFKNKISYRNWKLEFSNTMLIKKETPSKKSLSGIKNFLVNLVGQTNDGEEKVQAIFGQSIFSEKEQIEIQKKYSIDEDKGCILWYTKGDKSKARYSPEIDIIKDGIKKQLESNLSSYKKDSILYNRAIIDLSNKISRALALESGKNKDLSKSGKLVGRIAWKALVNDRHKVFVKNSPSASATMTVDILLDASASRIDYQTEIAIQAYILAKSMDKCQIPVRVSSFNTVNNYTVFNIHKDFEEESDINKILSYKAMGWNRDGLAYKGFKQLTGDNKNKLLIILTDAKPNDLKPYRVNSLVYKNYQGDLALDAASRSLGQLRRNGFEIAAIITGDDQSSHNAKKLFQTNFVKIHTAKQISGVCGRFIQNSIEKISRKT